jgi:hypothetical protein
MVWNTPVLQLDVVRMDEALTSQKFIIGDSVILHEVYGIGVRMLSGQKTGIRGDRPESVA